MWAKTVTVLTIFQQIGILFVFTGAFTVFLELLQNGSVYNTCPECAVVPLPASMSDSSIQCVSPC